MNRTWKLLILILMVGLVAWAVSDTLYAQRIGRGGGQIGTGALQYVIKFVCGTFTTSALEEVAPGFYYTDINVHNPNDLQVKFRKKIALDDPSPQKHGLQTSPVDVILGGDEALNINCTDIYRLIVSLEGYGGITFTGTLIEGYVVLYSRYKLDVAGIYTTCGINCDEPDPAGSATLISSIQVDELIPASPVAAPKVGVNGLSVSSAGVELSVKPFSRFAYDGARLQIFDTNGQPLYNGSFTSGTRLTWRPLATDGRPLANGVYFYRVTVRDVLGQMSSKLGTFALMR